jgi:hypothetical protein
MDNKRIENYKKAAESYAAIIYDEKIKLFEYEEVLIEKKQEYQRMFFLKRLLDKNKKNYIETVNKYINISTNRIKETKKALENDKDMLIKTCIDDYINNDKKRAAEYHLLKNKFNTQKSIFEIVNTAEKHGRKAVESLYSTIGEINNILAFEALTTSYDDIFIPEINRQIVNTIGFIECFKKSVTYGAIQVKGVNSLEDVSIWENTSNVLKDDKIQYITIRNSRRQLKTNITDINTSLAVMKVAHNIMNNERNRLVEPYNLANRKFNSFWNEMTAAVKDNLEKHDVKV